MSRRPPYPVLLAALLVAGWVSDHQIVPWVAARSLWAAWIPHTVGDFIGDTIVKL